MQNECSASSSLIDGQATVTVCRKRDGELTVEQKRREGTCGHKGRARELERLGAASAQCKTN